MGRIGESRRRKKILSNPKNKVTGPSILLETNCRGDQMELIGLSDLSLYGVRPIPVSPSRRFRDHRSGSVSPKPEPYLFLTPEGVRTIRTDTTPGAVATLTTYPPKSSRR